MLARVLLLTCLVVAGMQSLGCRHGRLGKSAADPSAWTQQLDLAWEAQGKGVLLLDDVALQDIPEQLRAHPDVHWRVTRYWLARASVADTRQDAIALYATARGEGLACLDGAPSFARRRAEWGWDQALRDIPQRRRLCASWLALAWVRWADAFGEDAGAVDLVRIGGVLDALDEDMGKAVVFNRDWARAILLSLPDTATDAAREQGRALFAALIRDSEGDRRLRVRADFYALHAHAEDPARWCALRATLRAAKTASPYTKAAVSSALARGDDGLRCERD